MNREMFYMIMQKVLGIMMIVLSVIAIKAGWMFDEVTNHNDGTFLLVLLPMALYMVLTKHNYLYENFE